MFPCSRSTERRLLFIPFSHKTFLPLGFAPTSESLRGFADQHSTMFYTPPHAYRYIFLCLALRNHADSNIFTTPLVGGSPQPLSTGCPYYESLPWGICTFWFKLSFQMFLRPVSHRYGCIIASHNAWSSINCNKNKYAR